MPKGEASLVVQRLHRSRQPRSAELQRGHKESSRLSGPACTEMEFVRNFPETPTHSIVSLSGPLIY